MAWMLADQLMGHLADITVRNGIISAFFVWVGFVLTTTAANHIFAGRRAVVTAIDAGHWLGVLIVMSAIVGAFGA
jgi:hypothetical protein